ncbi:MAG: isoprenylcysteine carboxylmethyltransferase family protein [Terriglobales bacterium]
MVVLRTAAWMIGIIYATVPSYWLMVHPRARSWEQGGGKRLMAVGPLWLLTWMTAGAITWSWRRVLLYSTPWTWAPGAALIFFGLTIYAFARRDFSVDQVLGRPELQPQKHEQRLVTAGIRSYVRHPYYLGHLCELLGWTIGTGLAVLYALTAFAVITGYFMIRAEERELEQRFGQAYRDYKARTAALIPGRRA